MASALEGVSAAVASTVDAVVARSTDLELEHPGLNLWVSEVLGRFSGIVERIAPGVDAQKLREETNRAVAAGEPGAPLAVDDVVAAAKESATGRDGDEVVARDLVEAVLAKAGVRLNEPATGHVVPVTIDAADGQAGSPAAEADGLSSTPGTPQSDSIPIGGASAVAARRTPTLDKLGLDLVGEARAGRLQPALGRDAETGTLIEVLCRTRKRNPLLIGAAGTGKTAIVESFACKIAEGDVPDLLGDVRLVALDTTALVSGTSLAGSLEERLRKIVAEASQPGIILFVDEVHSVVTSGGRDHVMADAFKPALARGELALIGATTDDEYRQYIKPDRALERRFQTVPITELGMEATLAIMRARRDRLIEERSVRVPDEVLEEMASFAEETMRNRTFPDKALDLLEQCVAYAVAQRLDDVDVEAAQTVLGRMVGIQVPPDEAIERLDTELAAFGLSEEDRAGILKRLGVTLHGLDLRAQRPNLVLALAGPAAHDVDVLARAFARALFDAENRVVQLDLSQIQDDESISMLVGPAPGYVGYGRRLAIHELEITPRAVVVVTGADICHPLAAETVAKGMRDGYIADTAGTRCYFSDAVVLLPHSRGMSDAKARPFGFAPDGATGEQTDESKDGVLAAAFGPSLAEQVDIDLRWSMQGRESSAGPGDLDGVMRRLAVHYGRRGVEIEWDPVVTEHLASLTARCAGAHERERVVEEWLSPLLLPVVRTANASRRRRARLTVTDGAPQVDVDNAEG